MVKDLKIAKIFYTNILNLEEIDRPDFLIKGLWYKLGESQLHLMLCEDTPRPHMHSLNETVQPHFAIALTNAVFSSTIQRLLFAKVSFVGEVEKNSFGVKQAFFYDPDQNMLEINNELS